MLLSGYCFAIKTGLANASGLKALVPDRIELGNSHCVKLG